MAMSKDKIDTLKEEISDDVEKIAASTRFDEQDYYKIEQKCCDIIDILNDNDPDEFKLDQKFAKLFVDVDGFGYAYFYKKPREEGKEKYKEKIYKYFQNIKDIIDIEDVKNIKDIKNIEDIKDIKDSSTFERKMFSLLIQHYYILCNKFNDIEVGLKMLLVNYEDKYFEHSKIEDQYVETMCGLISWCGRRGDSGYAFNGLNILENNIDEIKSDKILLSILDNLTFKNQHVSNDVKDKQIKVLIDSLYKKIKKDSKDGELQKNLQICFLVFPKIMISVLQHQDELYNFENPDIKADSENYFTVKKTNGDSSIIKNIVYFVSDKVRYEIELCDSKKLILEFENDSIIAYSGVADDKNKLELDHVDQIDMIFRYNKYKKLIDSINLYIDLPIEKREIFISHIYLKDKYVKTKDKDVYKTYNISLDGQFEYNDGKFKKLDNDVMNDFFNKYIESACIVVGKNGDGKTNFLDFIRNYLFIILNTYEKASDKIETDERLTKINKRYEYFIIVKENIIQAGTTKTIYSYAKSKGIIFNESQSEIEDFEEYVKKNTSDTNLVFFTNAENQNEYFAVNTEIDNKSENTIDLTSRYINTNRNLILATLQKSEDKSVDENMYLKSNQEFIRQIIYLTYYLENKKYLPEVNSSNKVKVYADHIEIDTINLDVNPLEALGALKTLKSYLNAEVNISNEQIEYDKKHYSLRFFSTGEYARFSFFARLFWHIRGYELLENIYNTVFTKLLFSDESLKLNSILLVDEGELYYHPEWQRKYIQDLVTAINCFFENKISDEDKIEMQDKKIQIVLTSNSPFLIADVPNNCINILQSESDQVPKFEKTFAQNIHLLLTDTMFLRETMGEFAKNKIIEIQENVNAYENKVEKRTEEEYIKLVKEINLIGELVIRNFLQNKLNITKSNEFNDILNMITKLPKQEQEALLKKISS